MPDINIHNSTPAFIGWQSNDALHSLTEPDPKYNNITLTAVKELRSESTSPPPSAVAYQQKRPRHYSHDDCDNAMLQIWAVLTTMKGRDARMEALENRIDVRRKAWKSSKSALHF
ncbi:hypothetical protein FOQG_18178 [Fusarium oxysporum f. sp. raphani 54005]|uniref:Uncharacterized protein n=2 Tax=Fusarium oxysporum f. sp. raphani TaxID=96318 RepID=X0B4P0_FUSOX|nr:hypothetical protein FOQG_18178 [Fusarium oxysporum f. sp. raphani 54005]KAG7424577.1 hypothetical protein Forpi1262_v014376 [Fusarium oxysporum f. sp. raphani]KAK2468521.1 hypothetical protein H9L39_20167 [Fusarium oxysporum f. sp. albedinis]